MSERDWTINLIGDGKALGRLENGRYAFAGIQYDDEGLLQLFVPPDGGNRSLSAASPPGYEAHRFEVLIQNKAGDVYIDVPSLGCHHVPANVVDLDQRNARTPFNHAHMIDLQNTKVALIGLGSFGSQVACQLAMAGCRQIWIVDPDVLKVHNLMRHVGTLKDVGRRKVDVVRDAIHAIDPAVEVTCIGEDLLDASEEQQDAFWKDCGVLVASTDRMSVQHQYADQVYRRSVPLVAAGCYESACGGEVFWKLPENHDGPCYGCLRSMTQAPRRGGIDYSTATSQEDYEGEPGLAAAIHQVASVASQITLGVMLRHHADSQVGQVVRDHQYILVGAAMSGGYFRFGGPFDSFIQPLAGRVPDCHTCGSTILQTI